jgi:ATP/maltotriose-dependent transcriptional regulator MalT
VSTLLLNDLADVPEDVILVLDDYHLIHSREVHTCNDQDAYQARVSQAERE